MEKQAVEEGMQSGHTSRGVPRLPLIYQEETHTRTGEDNMRKSLWKNSLNKQKYTGEISSNKEMGKLEYTQQLETKNHP
jgi:hypothetical protein